MNVDARLPATPAAPRAARRLLSDSLADSVPDGRLSDAQLAVSELVTNSVRHAGLRDDDDVTLRLVLSESTLRVEVLDSGAGYAPGSVLQPGPEDAGGWGLSIVREVTDRAGYRPNVPNVSWFEIDLEA